MSDIASLTDPSTNGTNRAFSERIEILETQVAALKQTIVILESLLHPQMPGIYQKYLGGLHVRADDPFRASGFFTAEEGSDPPMAWSNLDEDTEIIFFGIKGDVYDAVLNLGLTRNISEPDPLEVQVDGIKVYVNRPDPNGSSFHFEYTCTETKWHRLSLRPRHGLFDVTERTDDIRNLGILFQDLQLSPKIG